MIKITNMLILIKNKFHTKNSKFEKSENITILIKSGCD